MSLWSAAELLEASHGEMQGDWGCDGLSIDSRDIAKGDLFVALKAARDGHEFVKMALSQGAAGALVSFVPEGCEDANLLIVDDVEAALARMGQYRRAQVDAKIVAITGSAGKTSTKEMLLTALSTYGKTHASVKSFNNHWLISLIVLTFVLLYSYPLQLVFWLFWGLFNAFLDILKSLCLYLTLLPHSFYIISYFI